MHCNFTGTLLVSVLPTVLSIEFILGALSNGLALWIFCFHLRPWKSSTVLLFNLAMADFLLNMILPFRASYYNSGIKWRFGKTLCNISQFMLALNRTGSTLFLMAIALDRYIRVVHPHHSINSLSPSKAMCGAVVLWLVTVCMTANALTLQNFRSDYCESFLVETSAKGNRLWHKFNFLFSCWMPLLVILFCTIRIICQLKGRQLSQHGKIKKALWFITVVVVVFIVCFLPSNIAQLLIWIETQEALKTLPESEVCAAMDNLTVVFYMTVSLTYLNSALDPVVYYFSSPTFKNICRKSLHLPQAETTESTEKRTRETGSHSCSQI
ncbi:hydroxycarboxylic acid receptor 2-like [Dunckerocampus dactyliophorus]|uniref:hydroxycarboxylic acid receptor 2-like n=1 Tax=Dunckerocampus dactyliophorus TaxID=161453 RepID=UPI002405A470|nr:hydroxycarboxylic acid receptor 2-like [Dunckerocampus dactyliophorus]